MCTNVVQHLRALLQHGESTLPHCVQGTGGESERSINQALGPGVTRGGTHLALQHVAGASQRVRGLQVQGHVAKPDVRGRHTGANGGMRVKAEPQARHLMQHRHRHTRTQVSTHTHTHASTTTCISSVVPARSGHRNSSHLKLSSQAPPTLVHQSLAQQPHGTRRASTCANPYD